MKKTNDRGFVTIEFVLGVGFLLLPVTLLLLVLPTWSERQSSARVASREAARTYVVTGDQNRAKEAALQVTDSNRIKRDSVTVTLMGDPQLRGSEVTATIAVKIPVSVIPILGANSDAFTLRSTHTEIVDLYKAVQ